MTANFLRKLFDRLVAPCRFLPQCHQHDVVEIALENLRVSNASRTEFCFFASGESGTRPRRFGVGDLPRNIGRRTAGKVIR